MVTFNGTSGNVVDDKMIDEECRNYAIEIVKFAEYAAKKSRTPGTWLLYLGLIETAYIISWR